jgi:hypothetical protein
VSGPDVGGLGVSGPGVGGLGVSGPGWSRRLGGLWTATGTLFPGWATLPVGAPEPDGSRCATLWRCATLQGPA